MICIYSPVFEVDPVIVSILLNLAGFSWLDISMLLVNILIRRTGNMLIIGQISGKCSGFDGQRKTNEQLTWDARIDGKFIVFGT